MALQSCQKYVARLSYTCANKTAYTTEISFTTKGCNTCSATDITMYAIPEATSMTIHWDVYPDALYVVNYRKAGEPAFKTYRL